MLSEIRRYFSQRLNGKRSRAVVVLSLVGLSYLTFSILALHWLVRDISPASRHVSEYALGDYGWLAVSGFLVGGLAIVALIRMLRLSLPPLARVGAGLGFLELWGLSLVVLSFFPSDIKGMPLTISGTLHALIAYFGLPLFASGAILASTRLRQLTPWRMIGWVALILAVTAWPLLILFSLGVVGDLSLAYDRVFISEWFTLFVRWVSTINGIVERLMLGLFLGWLGVIALTLLRQPARVYQ